MKVENNKSKGLFLYEHQRDYFIKQLVDNYLIYETKIAPAISLDSLEEALKFQNERLSGKTAPFFENHYQYCNDEEDVFINIESETYRYYEFLNNTKYRILAMWICCTCQLWEQQLLRFVSQEIKNGDMSIDKKINDWGSLDKLLKDCEIKIEELPYGNKILELRKVVNVLKHSEGRSEKELRESRPDIFMVNGRDNLDRFNTTLGEVVLNLTEKDLEEYTESLVDFWRNFPVNKWILKTK